MSAASIVLLNLLAAALLAGLAGFGVASAGEGERRAARLSFLCAVLASAPFLAASFAPYPVRWILLAAVALTILSAVVLWFLPVGARVPGGGRPSRRVDERLMSSAG